MPVAAPENPLGASGAFSRKLSVRRDTYQLIFTGASPGRATFDILPRTFLTRATKKLVVDNDKEWPDTE